MNAFTSLFNSSKCVVIGMIHVKAIPGTPKSCNSVQKLVDLACEEAHTYKKCGMDGVLIENMFDVPYLRSTESGPEVTATMTRVCSEVRKILSPLPCGVQILAGNNCAAVAVALASGCQFIRAEGFAFAHVGDEGLMDACAGPLLRYRRMIGAEHVLVFCDVKKKHSSHAITSDITVTDMVKAVDFFLGDGIIVTGSTTGKAPSLVDFKDARSGTTLPVLIGSGVDINNVNNFISANGVIIGSHFKHADDWKGKLATDKVYRFMCKIKNLRS